MHEDGWERTRVLGLITPAAGAAAGAEELWSEAFSGNTHFHLLGCNLEERVQARHPIMVRYRGVGTREKMARECLMIILLEETLIIGSFNT